MFDDEAAAAAFGRSVFEMIREAGVDRDEALKRFKWTLTASESALADKMLDPVYREAVHYADMLGRERAQTRRAMETSLGRPWGEPVRTSTWAKPPGEKYRFEGGPLSNGRNGVIARRKIGKSTVGLSVTRDYLEDSPLFGYYPMAGSFAGRRVLMLNYELTESYLWGEVERAGLRSDRFDIWNLKGATNPLAHDSGRRELQARLADDVGCLYVDPQSVATRGVVSNDNDNNAMRGFYGMLDDVVGPEIDVWMSMHAGHDPTRDEQARGASEAEGWVDTMLAVTRDPKEGPRRFLSIDGRGVTEPRGGADGLPLTFDAATHLLTVDKAGMTKGEARKAERETEDLAKDLAKSIRVADLEKAAVSECRSTPGIHTRDLEMFLGGKKDEARLAIARVLKRGEIVRVKAAKGTAQCHYIRGEEPTS